MPTGYCAQWQQATVDVGIAHTPLRLFHCFYFTLFPMDSQLSYISITDKRFGEAGKKERLTRTRTPYFTEAGVSVCWILESDWSEVEMVLI